VNSKGQTMPAATSRVRIYPNVSCITRDSADWSHQTNVRLFDVPEEEYSDGVLTGVKVAWEVIRESATTADHEITRSVVQAAVAAMSAPGSGPSRKGAAVGFLDSLCMVLRDATMAWDFRPTLIKEIQAHEEFCETPLREMKHSNAAFIAAMSEPRGSIQI